jgi:drug/metabolite transporter (DMT)-like permease
MAERESATVAKRTGFAGVPLIMLPLLVVDSLHFVFARLLVPYLPGVTAAFFVLTVAFVELAIYMGIRRRIHFGTFTANYRFFLVIGALVAASTALNYEAVSYIDPGTASLLAQTTTLFALVLSIVWLQERLAPLEIAGALIALSGVFIITFQPGEYLRLGSLLVLTSAFMYSLHAAIVKRHGGDMDFGNFFLFRVASVSFFLLIFTLGRGQLMWPEGQAWFWLILIGTVDVVFSRVLYYLALRRLQMSFHTIILTVSPVLTILWSLVLFGVRPTTIGIIGGIAVLSGVAIVTASLSRR